MLDIVRQKSGRAHILFIVDEVGQYIASRDNLILNLDGLAKNLKRLGEGKVWIIATAQQTLTEDNPRAALNSDKLYKLKDRFPIQIDLESSDIKEICYRRLLRKSPAYEGARAAAVEESRQKQVQIFLLGRTSAEMQTIAEEIYRCQRIEELYRNDPDQEVREYCKNQINRADGLKVELQRKLRQSLSQGSFVFRGQVTAVSTLSQEFWMLPANT